ncbi:MAG: cysteine desulfurase [Clostridia bacterium]|nr:cysteine desulfurase [Clostridia bacterium]
MIYADNAATTKMSDAAKDTMLKLTEQTWGNPSGLYSHGQEARKALEKARDEIAGCIGADAAEIIFTSGGSESDNQAILSAAEIGAKTGKRHIISDTFEHHAVLHTLDRLKEKGFEITLLDVRKNGIINPADVQDAIREDTCLVTIMYANNEIGTIQPIKEIGRICRSRQVLFHTDAVQAAGHIPIDVNQDNIDLLSASAHKFNGPKGTGFLYARRSVKLTSLILGGVQERGRRAGTENVPAVAAMAVALKEKQEKMAETAARVAGMRDRLFSGLCRIPHSAVNGDAKRRLPGNVNISFEGVEGEALIMLLDDRGIQASVGSACTSGSLDPSHVLLAIGREYDIARASLRLSIDDSIGEEEIDCIIRNVAEVVGYLRGFSSLWKELMSGKRKFVL